MEPDFPETARAEAPETRSGASAAGAVARFAGPVVGIGASAGGLEALREMREYVRTYKERTSSYTIQWSAREESGLQTSYFRAKNVLEALDKLFYDRDPNSITVFSVILNPIT